MAGRGRGHGHPLRRERWASTRRARASPTTPCGTSPTRRRTSYPLLLHYPYFDLYRKQVVKQADLVLAHAPAGRRVHPRRRTATSLLRGAHGARLVAVGVHPGGGGGRAGLPGAGPRLPGRGRADGPATTEPATPATACTWRRWPARGPRWSRASAACGPGRRACRSRPGCRRGSAGWRFRVRYRGSCVAVTTDGHRHLPSCWRAGHQMTHHGEPVEAGRGDAGRARGRSSPAAAPAPGPTQPRGPRAGAPASQQRLIDRTRRSAQVMSSIRWRATARPLGGVGVHRDRLTTLAATSSSSTQARWGSSMRYIVEHGQIERVERHDGLVGVLLRPAG